MNIHLEQSFFVYSNPESILSWLREWQRSQGFEMVNEETSSATLTRGSRWRAAFTMDIRKIPTKLSVTMDGSYPCLLNVEMRCRSRLSMQTPGDKGKLEKDLNKLVDALWNQQKGESFQQADIDPEKTRSAACGSHSLRVGVSVCDRCGQFLCHPCRGTVNHCIACIQRMRVQ
ncbi:MAG: hypothetical protein P1V97_15805 [Planctomycetota bacterium]|nr:hypothetical protein [Planctomycetota bacterium]